MWISRKTYEQLKLAQENLQSTLKSLDKSQQDLLERPYLIDMERKGRENIFTFSRAGKVSQITTMGLISDDWPTWKENLIR